MFCKPDSGRRKEPNSNSQLRNGDSATEKVMEKSLAMPRTKGQSPNRIRVKLDKPPREIGISMHAALDQKHYRDLVTSCIFEIEQTQLSTVSFTIAALRHRLTYVSSLSPNDRRG